MSCSRSIFNLNSKLEVSSSFRKDVSCFILNNLLRCEMPKQLRFKDGDRKQISFYWSKSQYKRFQEKYPNLTTLFLTRCLQRAVNEPGFVDAVIFGEAVNASSFNN